MELLTADTITDEEVRDLRAALVSEGKATLLGRCDEALGLIHRHGSTVLKARRQCAEILNERRAAEGK